MRRFLRCHLPSLCVPLWTFRLALCSLIELLYEFLEANCVILGVTRAGARFCLDPVPVAHEWLPTALLGALGVEHNCLMPILEKRGVRNVFEALYKD